MARTPRIADLWDNASWHTRDRMFLAWTEYEADNKIANEEYELLRDAEIEAEERLQRAREGNKKGFPVPRDEQGRELCRKKLHLFEDPNIIRRKAPGGRIHRQCRQCFNASRRLRDRAESNRRKQVA